MKAIPNTDPLDLKSKCNFSHLTLEKRKELLEELKLCHHLNEVALRLNVSESTVSRELKRNRNFVKNRTKRKTCKHIKECKVKCLCKGKSCKDYCKFCPFLVNCESTCPDYQATTCSRLSRFPYVCDGCPKAGSCVLDHYHYDPKDADAKARTALVESRRGIDLIEEDFISIDKAVSEGTSKGQSIEHVASYNNFPVTARTIRRYVNHGLLSTQKLDTPRGAMLKPRKVIITKAHKSEILRAKEGRDLASFINYMNENTNLLFSELDTVEGPADERKEKRIMTIICPLTKLFFSMLLPNGTSIAVKNAFDKLHCILGDADFSFVFGTLLTDNGHEFSRPEDIEICSDTGEQRSHVFFCNPYSAWQKGSLEVCHELLRRIIPKGSSLRSITVDDIRLINSHINSYVRESIDTSSAYDLFVRSFGNRGELILKKLHIRKIPPEDVNLTPNLIRHPKKS